MCDECGIINGHATACPNNPDCVLDEPETVTCAICGEEKPDEDCLNGVCAECIRKATTFKTALAYGEDRPSCVELNGFLAYEFTKDQIEEILTTALLDAHMLTGATFGAGYISDDASDFADWLKEKPRDGISGA